MIYLNKWKTDVAKVSSQQKEWSGARWANTDAALKAATLYVFSGRVGDVLCFSAAWAELLVRWHAACYLDPRTEWVDHIPLRGHTLTHTLIHMHPHHAEVPVHCEDAWLFAAEEENFIWEQVPVSLPSSLRLTLTYGMRIVPVFHTKIIKRQKKFKDATCFCCFFVFIFCHLTLFDRICLGFLCWLYDLHESHYLWQHVLF